MHTGTHMQHKNTCMHTHMQHTNTPSYAHTLNRKICTDVCTHAHRYTHVSAHMYTQMQHIKICTHVIMFMRIRTTHTFMLTYAYIHTWAHECARIYAHTCTCSLTHVHGSCICTDALPYSHTCAYHACMRSETCTCTRAHTHRIQSSERCEGSCYLGEMYSLSVR